jgi:hypothetical protein
MKTFLVQEEQRLRLRCITLEHDLAEKEQQLQDALTRQQQLAESVCILRSKEVRIKEENECLVRSKVTICRINNMPSTELYKKQNFRHLL